jgi:glycosyltransferase involved in cell wall biosynthesis
MKILHVIPSFFPAHYYGGPVQSVYQLCRALASAGHQIRVLTTNASGPKSELYVMPGVEIELTQGLRAIYCKRHFREDMAPAMLTPLPGLLRWADVVHLTAVYSLPTIPALVGCKAMDKPLLWSPRGSLQHWEGSTKLVAKRIWNGFCRALLPRRVILHVTSEQEAEESLAHYPGVQAAMIPNGIEAPAVAEHKTGDGMLRIVFLGRLHAKKGIENLLEACAGLTHAALSWSLVIAGTGDPAYAATLRARIAALGIAQHVNMVGEIVGEGKRQLFESADLAVFPSYTENFGLVIAEALSYGVPVIASRGTPWSEVVSRGCGLWVDNDPQTLRESILQMSTMPLETMGRRGREWMLSEFDWQNVARRTTSIYERLLNGAATDQAVFLAPRLT